MTTPTKTVTTFPVAELSGLALDWAVARFQMPTNSHGWLVCAKALQYSGNWANGGPIIEQNGIEMFRNNEKNYWFTSPSRGRVGCGPTALVAAMRSYVATKAGDTIEVPEEVLVESSRRMRERGY